MVTDDVFMPSEILSEFHETSTSTGENLLPGALSVILDKASKAMTVSWTKKKTR